MRNTLQFYDPKTIEKNQGKFINLHYSLLPAFSGLMGVEPIKQAYEKGCKFIGPTCHMVDEGVDTGPIISQAAFTTNRSIQDAIELMFRLGCLILLNGVYITQKNSEFIENRKENPQFSPPLRFDISCFDENLWQKVANA